MSKTRKCEPETPRYRGSNSALYHALTCCVLAIVFLLAWFPVKSDDLFLYLELGRHFFADLRLPEVDPYLYTIRNYHWDVWHAWGTYVVFYAVYLLGGWTGLVICKSLLICAVSMIPFAVARARQYRSPLVAVIVVLSAYAGCYRFVERSSLFSESLTALTLLIVILRNVNPRKYSALWYVLPVIFLFWVNLHPGFYPGLAAVGCAVILDGLALIPARNRPRAVRPFIAAATVFVLCAAACLINPLGVKGFLYPLRLVGSDAWKPYRQYNPEWMSTLSPLYRASGPVLAFYALLAACVVVFTVALYRQRGRKQLSFPLYELLMCGMLVHLGLSAFRFLATASFGLGICLTAVAARYGVLRLNPGTAARNAIMSLSALVLALALIVKLAFWGYCPLGERRLHGGGLDLDCQPVRASAFLDKVNPDVPMFNQHEYGAYLMWKYRGSRKLFYHGGVTDMTFFDNEYIAISKSEADFDRIVRDYGIGVFFLRTYEATPERGPLVCRLLLYRKPEWHLVYVDNVGMIFLKEIPENMRLIDRYSYRLHPRPIAW